VREDAVSVLEGGMCFAMAAVLCAVLLEGGMYFAMAAVLCALLPQDIDILETVLANIRVSGIIQVMAYQFTEKPVPEITHKWKS